MPATVPTAELERRFLDARQALIERLVDGGMREREIAERINVRVGKRPRTLIDDAFDEMVGSIFGGRRGSR